MNISHNGLEFLIRQEGKRLAPYKDSAGKLTIGVGHLIKQGEHFDFITDAQCEELLKNDLATTENAINRYVKVKINQNQFDALCSLVFNIGTGAFYTSSVLRFLNKNWIEDAADAFLLYKNAGGAFSKGLYARRQRERELFLS
jgi:lysozyme